MCVWGGGPLEADELDGDGAAAGPVEVDGEDALPRAEGQPAGGDGQGLGGAEQRGEEVGVGVGGLLGAPGAEGGRVGDVPAVGDDAALVLLRLRGGGDPPSGSRCARVRFACAA